MKIAIVYSSITGNTKLLAENIKDSLTNKDIIYCDKVKENIPEADIYIIGSWTNRGDASEDIKSFLPKIKNKKIAYFATAGFGGDSTYYETLYNRVKQYIDSSNEILGHFYCQGKMPMSTKERYIKMITQNPDDANLKVSLKNFEEALHHPNEEDLTNVKDWIKEIIK